MGVYRRKDKKNKPYGPWIIQFPHRRDSFSNRIIYTTKTVGSSKRLARRMLAKKLIEWEHRKLTGQDTHSPLSISQLLDWYLELPEVQAKRSYKLNQSNAGLLKKELGHLRLGQLTPQLLTAWRTQMLKKKSSRGRVYMPGSINRYMDMLKRVFNLAVRDGLMDKNPCWKIRALTEDNARNRIIEPDEFQAIFNQLPEHAKWPVLTAYLTGMRSKEVLSLTWGQIDIAKGFFEIPAPKSKTKRPRAVPIPQPVLKWLRESKWGKSCDHIFVYRGKPLKSFRAAFKNACKRAGVAPALPHDLRHSFVTLLRRAGVERSLIKRVTGQSTDSIFERYNTVSDQETPEVVGKMVEIFCKL